MRRLVVLVAFAVVAMMVPVGANKVQAEDTSPSMKQVLLSPKGFDMDWTCTTRGLSSLDGRSHVVFREDGIKIAVKINSNQSRDCTTDAKLTDNVVVFDGCDITTHDITLSYDPGNKKIPFKGRAFGCSRVVLSPR